MKSIVSLVALSILVFSAQAQPNNVITAYMKLQEGDLADAQADIEAAMEHEKTSSQAKTWYYGGKIYMAIYNECGKTDAMFDGYPADYYIGLAKHAYFKATTYDVSRIDENQLMREYQITADYMLNEGVALYNDKEYERAALMFEGCILVKKDFEIVDSLATFNAALAHEKAGNPYKAIGYYKDCATMMYNGEDAYLSAINIMREVGHQDEALFTMELARTAYPEDLALITAEINLFLAAEEYGKALFSVDQAIVLMPENADLHYSRGYLMESSNMEESIASYKKAIELNPNHVNATYNLGAAYYNKAVELRNADDATAETGVDELKQARQYLEKVEAMSPGIGQVQSSLQMIQEILQD